MKKLIEKIIGSYSDREIKRIMGLVERIEKYAEQMKRLDNHQLQEYTPLFRDRLARGESMDDILPEAFAVVREASTRVLGMTHFRVQLIGGIVLHQGRIAEMKTGEGKTLVATLPVYLNALNGEGVHVVTVNDYLAKRDSEWMGKVYQFLGLSVGLIVYGIDNQERKKAYECDLTYGTNNEFGFDYLRDNMVIYKKNMVQRPHVYAIVDEVDSILIDEARTPLIISGSGDKSTNLYTQVNSFARTLRKQVFAETDDKKGDEGVDADYVVDEKAGSATLTARGLEKAERYFKIDSLSDPENMTLFHHINQALKANGIMKRDKDYVVKDNEIIIIDEFTGRMMFGRRYSNGLHQAIEAKEDVKVERESKTLATITFQNYFRLYRKLAGMTGTALTEEEEFRDIYKLDVISIPTNQPVIRKDAPDAVYKSEKGKYEAILQEVQECYHRKQPILIGTISIEKSEDLSTLLRRRGIPHEVLNAKYHEREAEIVAQAGKSGSVTIATNMAGRGTDIVLGGNAEFMALRQMRKEGYTDEILAQVTSFNETTDEEIIQTRKVFRQLNADIKLQLAEDRRKVLDAGGLYILGTERHEARRIDNQLRGRSGRQGDPGQSRFFISLEDDLMRLFGQDRLTGIVNFLKLPEDMPIEHQMLSNVIETSQKRVEGRNFNTRKYVIQYDDVMNKQREIIYDQRKKVLDGENIRDVFIKMGNSSVEKLVQVYCSEEGNPRKWDWFSILQRFNTLFPFGNPLEIPEEERRRMDPKELSEKLSDIAQEKYRKKEEELGEQAMREAERIILLRTVDEKWMDHIDAMDQLRQGIGLRAYGQRDPVMEYKFEGFEMFEDMIISIQETSMRMLMSVSVERPEVLRRREFQTNLQGGKSSVRGAKRDSLRVGRNDPCPCGSGKKHKKCCGTAE